MANLPFVSAIIVTRNEESYIKEAMVSLIQQSYPQDKYEIVIVDGMSTDKTRSIVLELQQEYQEKLPIRLLDNEKHILASGWNIGIKAASGEYVVRIDAHAKAAPDFIEKSVETMLSHDAVCVGGKLESAQLSGGNELVAKVLSSPFGVGNSSFRVAEEGCYADTAVYGLYKKDVFNEMGFFDETMVRNQDIELHSRIRKAVYKFYFNPDIHCTYFTRNTVKKMLKQGYGNGKWNMVLLKRGTGALSLRHLIPFVFVLSVIGLGALGFVWSGFWWLLLAEICLHLALGLFFATKKTSKIGQIVTMPFLFMALHIAYGCGYFAGLFVK